MPAAWLAHCKSGPAGATHSERLEDVPQCKLARPPCAQRVVVVLKGGRQGGGQHQDQAWAEGAGQRTSDAVAGPCRRTATCTAAWPGRRAGPCPQRQLPSQPGLTISNTSTSASASCCCRVKRERQYCLVRPGPQGPQQRTMEPGVTPHSHTRVANLRPGGGAACATCCCMCVPQLPVQGHARRAGLPPALQLRSHTPNLLGARRTGTACRAKSRGCAAPQEPASPRAGVPRPLGTAGTGWAGRGVCEGAAWGAADPSPATRPLDCHMRDHTAGPPCPIIRSHHEDQVLHALRVRQRIAGRQVAAHGVPGKEGQEKREGSESGGLTQA